MTKFYDKILYRIIIITNYMNLFETHTINNNYIKFVLKFSANKFGPNW